MMEKGDWKYAAALAALLLLAGCSSTRSGGDGGSTLTATDNVTNAPVAGGVNDVGLGGEAAERRLVQCLGGEAQALALRRTSQGGHEVPEPVQRHRRNQTGEWGEYPYGSARRAGGEPQAEPGHRGEQRMREAGQRHAPEEDRQREERPRLWALLRTTGIAIAAEIEDVLHHGEPGGR